MKALGVLLVASAVSLSWCLVLFTTPTGGLDHGAEERPDGEVLYLTQCVSCHGVEGEGIDGRGPTLIGEGEAAVHFVLTTGRMPLPEPEAIPRRGPVRYDDDEIDALVAYVGQLGGPGIPDVDPRRGDVAVGAELYRLNCAACHVASGSGAIIGGGREAPSLMATTPTQVGEAIIIGPGAMPVFAELGPNEIDDIAAYVVSLQEERTTSAASLGGVGPVAEGLAAWLLVLVPLIGVTRWIGEPRPDDRSPQPDTGANR